MAKRKKKKFLNTHLHLKDNEVKGAPQGFRKVEWRPEGRLNVVVRSKGKLTKMSRKKFDLIKEASWQR